MFNDVWYNSCLKSYWHWQVVAENIGVDMLHSSGENVEEVVWSQLKVCTHVSPQARTCHVSLSAGRLNSACWELSLVFQAVGEGGGAWAENNEYQR